MQSASSRSWTRVDESVSNDDNHYTTVCMYVVYLQGVLKIDIIWNVQGVSDKSI